MFRADGARAGVDSWSYTRTKAVVMVMVFAVDMTGPAGPSVRLLYFPERGGELVDCRVPLVHTPPYFGGLRWWFACPMPAESGRCGRRVAKLFLPPGGRQFGCRHCHGLVYTSSQQAHADDRVLRMLADSTGFQPGELRRLLCGRAGSIW